jgi:hypothetical protein
MSVLGVADPIPMGLQFMGPKVAILSAERDADVDADRLPPTTPNGALGETYAATVMGATTSRPHEATAIVSFILVFSNFLNNKCVI